MPQNHIVYNTLKNLYLNLPHSRALGLGFIGEDGRDPLMYIDWRLDLLGRQTEQTLHGGVITTLVDVVGAVAVAAHLPQLESLATLDLRMDYLHAPLPEKRVLARAECYRLHGQIAFVRTSCFQIKSREPFALATATYIRSPMPPEIQQHILEDK